VTDRRLPGLGAFRFAGITAGEGVYQGPAPQASLRAVQFEAPRFGSGERRARG
jgi:hypothetical protein